MLEGKARPSAFPRTNSGAQGEECRMSRCRSCYRTSFCFSTVGNGTGTVPHRLSPRRVGLRAFWPGFFASVQRCLRRVGFGGTGDRHASHARQSPYETPSGGGCLSRRLGQRDAGLVQTRRAGLSKKLLHPGFRLCRCLTHNHLKLFKIFL